jgi:hypothetical protein
MKSYSNKLSFQGTCDIYGDFGSKDQNSKASIEKYRTRQFPMGAGPVSINPWLINMNSWLKPREKKAAKWELNCPCIMGQRSSTKMALASGIYGRKSYTSLEQTMLGVKREPTDLDLRSQYRTLETFFSLVLNEKEGEIGRKRMPWVTPRINLLVNPQGCRLPMTLFDKDVLVICP